MATTLRTINVLMMAAIAIGISGCGSGSSSNGGGSMSQAAAQADAQKTAAQQAEEQAAQAAQREAAAKASAAQAASEPQRQVAQRGDIGEGGYLVAIGGARRHVLNRLDDLAWTQGVQHFQATEGRLPKDHAEFMSKIVEPLGIDLGYIEEGQEFLYDPNEGQWGTVYVVQMEGAAAPAPAP
jgi:hypothetical protein